MRYILLMLLVFSGLVSIGQTNPSGFPSQNLAGWITNDYTVPRLGTVVPANTPNFTPRFPGTSVLYQQAGVDSSIHFWNGARWVKIITSVSPTPTVWGAITGTLSNQTDLQNALNLKLNITDTANQWINGLRRRSGTDTVEFYKNGSWQFAYKDSTSSGGSGLTSVGLSMPSAFTVTNSPLVSNGTISVSGAGSTSQYIRGNGTLATTDTGMIPNFHLKVRSLFSASSPLTYNSTSGAFGITDANTSGTKGAATFSNGDFSDNGSGLISLSTKISASSCTNCNITYNSKGQITSATNGSGGGGGGITSLGVIGSNPNDSGATISGSVLNLEPATSNFGGVLTSDTQSIGGDKFFLGYRTTFNGNAPRVNSQWIPTSKQPDSIYLADRYLGFGFIDMFASGTYVMVYTNAENHVCDGGIIMLAKSKDQGRTWVTDTIVPGGVGYDVTMGGGGITQSNRLIVFFQRLDNTTQNGIDLRIMYSDDEGETFSAQQTQPTASQTAYQMYGPLCKIGGDSLLLSWYGITAGTYTSYVIKSGDDGETWSNPITVVSSSASQYTESSFAHLGGQTIMGLIRREQSDSTYAQVISFDNGNTWAYQGRVSWGIQATPAWLKTFQGPNGKRVVVAYHRSGTLGDYDERAIYGYADSLILGPSKWDLNSEVVIADNLEGSGYLTVVHPYDQMYGIGYYYDETNPQSDATIKFVLVPYGTNLPIGSASGISGLTSPRIPVASSSTTLTDYSSLKYNSTSHTIVLNGGSPQTWSGHNGGGIETSKSAIYVSDDGNANVMSNLYLDTDYKYKTNGAGAMMLTFNGATFFYNAPSGIAGNVASLTERLRLGANGEYYVNGSAGSSGQVIMSNGIGSGAAWASIVSSQWVDVTGGINYPVGYIAGGTSSPIAPLHINATTSGVGGYTTVMSDNNSSNGAVFVWGWRGGASNQKYKAEFIDGNGTSWGTLTDALNAAPVAQMTLDHSGELGIGTTNPLFKLDVNGKAAVRTTDSSASPANMVWIDPNTREFKVAAVPSGGSATTIYNGDGSISSNRTVTLGSNNLIFNASSTGDIDFTLGSDATGDIYYRNSSGFFTRLGIGTSGDVLTVSGGLPSWGAGAGITTLNTLTASTQTFATGTSGTDFNISSSTSTHTFNIPSASTSNRGLVTTSSQTFGGQKTFNNGAVVTTPTSSAGTSLVVSGDRSLAIAPGVAGIGMQLSSFTYTNTSGAGTETGNHQFHSVGTPTLTSSSAISYTGDVATVRFSGAPVAAGSTTISHPWNILSNDVSKFAALAVAVNEQSTDATIGVASGFNVYTGSGGHTFTLPALSIHPGKIVFIKNAGSGNLTVQRAGSDNIYDTSSVTSITVAAGVARIFIAGSSFWYVQ